jgi:UDP-2-acetamido-3-amino-2,3-dideoxy-glucuronate N-acetyltransferase
MNLLRLIDWKRRGVKVWRPCNVYSTARLGNYVSVGRFSEIGACVEIGDHTRIGMGVFIPKGVIIGDHCFLGPRVCFVHDKLLWDRFPENEDHWQQTVVESGAVIGANALICPGIRIGEGALIGIGSVVTKDVGPYEVWYGNPAQMHRKRNGGKDGQD